MNHSIYAHCPRWYHEYESGLVFTRPLSFYVDIIPFLENRILHIIEFSKRCKRQKLSHAFKLALHKFMHTDGPQSIIQITCLSEKNSPGNDFKWVLKPLKIQSLKFKDMEFSNSIEIQLESSKRHVPKSNEENWYILTIEIESKFDRFSNRIPHS